MTKTIIGGGFTVIVAVFGILFFLLAVTIPLFQGADVEEMCIRDRVDAAQQRGLSTSGRADERRHPAVSYTHLDVYKRQEPFASSNWTCAFSTAFPVEREYT